MHHRHSRSLPWLERQHAIEMRGAPTIKVDSFRELLNVVGAAMQSPKASPSMRSLGEMLNVIGGQHLSEYAFRLGVKHGRMVAAEKIAVPSDWPEDGKGGCQARNVNGAKCSFEVRHDGTSHRFCRRHPHAGYCVAACFFDWDGET